MVDRIEHLPARTEPAGLPAGLSQTLHTGRFPQSMLPQALDDGFGIDPEPGPIELQIGLDPGSFDVASNGEQVLNIGPHWP